MLYVVVYLGFLLLYGRNLVCRSLYIELGYLLYRLFHQSGDVFVSDFLAEQVLVFQHGALDILELSLPCPGVVLQYLVDPVLEEYLLKGRIVPFALHLFEPYLQFLTYQALGPFRIVPENVIHAHEVGLLVLDDTGVWRNAHFAVSACVQGIYGLVRGDVVVQLYYYLGVLGCVVVYLADSYLAFLVGLQYGVYDLTGGSLLLSGRPDRGRSPRL